MTNTSQLGDNQITWNITGDNAMVVYPEKYRLKQCPVCSQMFRNVPNHIKTHKGQV